jgi:hypothetical protein
MTLLARLVSKEEGFGVPGALPTRNHNPGDLRHAPGETHDPDAPDAIGCFDDDADGWAALERQLQLDAERGMTLAGFVDTYAPPTENNTQRYLDYLCQGLNLPPTALVSEALEIP